MMDSISLIITSCLRRVCVLEKRRNREVEETRKIFNLYLYALDHPEASKLGQLLKFMTWTIILMNAIVQDIHKQKDSLSTY